MRADSRTPPATDRPEVVGGVPGARVTAVPAEWARAVIPSTVRVKVTFSGPVPRVVGGGGPAVLGGTHVGRGRRRAAAGGEPGGLVVGVERRRRGAPDGGVVVVWLPSAS